MFTIYVYVLDTLADWELGYVTAELNSGRFFRRAARVTQNGQRFPGNRHYHGRIDYYA